MSENNRLILILMLDNIEKIFRYTESFSSAADFEKDTKSFDATLMNFIALGESSSKLSADFKDRNKQIDWRKIYAFRNVLAHDYFGILPEEVWEIIKKHLPKLKSEIGNLL